MKAIRIHSFGGPEVLRLEDAPDPKPGPGQIVVRVRAVGVNPVETYIRAGNYGPREMPFTPGGDAAGIVESVGGNVTRFKPGDRVYTCATLSGAYAEVALCDERSVHPLPARTTFEQGAALGVPYATAHRALFARAQAKAGEFVLVHGGSGGVGTAAIQLARAVGMIVIATAGTERGRQLVAEQGAEHVLDHNDFDALMKLTSGRGVDVILEMLANVNLARDLSVLANRGRIVVIGSRGRIEIDPRELMRRDADVRGMILFNATPEELTAIHADLIAGLERGTLRPVIGQSFGLDQAARAHQAIAAGGSFGKIVLLP